MVDRKQDVSGLAASSNIVVSGGELDRRIAGMDIYVGVPSEAPLPEGRACHAAKRYLDFMTTGEPAMIADLFEDDAVHMGALGHHLRGREEIDQFFMGVIGPMKRKCIPVAYCGNDDECLVVVAVETKVGDETRWGLTVVDHFTMGRSGKISRLVAFPRPNAH